MSSKAPRRLVSCRAGTERSSAAIVRSGGPAEGGRTLPLNMKRDTLKLSLAITCRSLDGEIARLGLKSGEVKRFEP
jgi:hypothetical protein